MVRCQEVRASKLSPKGSEGGTTTSAEIAPVALLPGDSDRISKFTHLWTKSKEVTGHRGYVVHTGRIGVQVRAIAHG